jgi:hypothetical protein
VAVVPLITSGHCGSSLVMQWLADFGFYTPPGHTDGRHPCGHHDHLAQEQIDLDREGLLAKVIELQKEHQDYALKFSAGFIHWPRFYFERARYVLLLRRDQKHVERLCGYAPGERKKKWLHWFLERLPKALDHLSDPLLALTWEEVLHDPELAVRLLYNHVRGGPVPPETLELALSRVK